MEVYGEGDFARQDWTDQWPEAPEALAAARSGASLHRTSADLTAQKTMGLWDVSTSPILGPSGEPERLLCVSRDITAIKVIQDELERAREAAEFAARHDSLTGLLNRAAFREQLE
jgi:predicted signal transduction protein with EAL and GGDEF domain